jgi:hypothetical protein
MPPLDPQRLARLRAHLLAAAAVATVGCNRNAEHTPDMPPHTINYAPEPIHINAPPAPHTINEPAPPAADASAQATADAAAAPQAAGDAATSRHTINAPAHGRERRSHTLNDPNED